MHCVQQWIILPDRNPRRGGQTNAPQGQMDLLPLATRSHVPRSANSFPPLFGITNSLTLHQWPDLCNLAKPQLRASRFLSLNSKGILKFTQKGCPLLLLFLWLCPLPPVASNARRSGRSGAMGKIRAWNNLCPSE
jgi:hypothetical protein